MPQWLLLSAAGVNAVRSKISGRETLPSFEQIRINSYSWHYSSARAERELGYRARPLDVTLRESHAWHLAEGRLTLAGLQRWWLRPESRAA